MNKLELVFSLWDQLDNLRLLALIPSGKSRYEENLIERREIRHRLSHVLNIPYNRLAANQVVVNGCLILIRKDHGKYD